MISNHNFCQILMKLEFSRQISEKHFNIKFHEIPSSGSRESLDEWTDGQTTKFIPAFRNLANNPKTRNLLRDLEYTCFQYTFFPTLYSPLTLNFWSSALGLMLGNLEYVKPSYLDVYSYWIKLHLSCVSGGRVTSNKNICEVQFYLLNKSTKSSILC